MGLVINEKAFHLAGIVPLAGQPLDFELDWHDSLMPIAPNYTAAESAVVECAWAGCETIWSVCHHKMAPLIRHRIGEYVNDPVYLGRKFDPRPSESRKLIPIFYVPIGSGDEGKRDGLPWSIIYGAHISNKVSSGISRWTSPDAYYVSFPYGIYPPDSLRDHRKKLSSGREVYLSYDGETVANGKYLGFAFTGRNLGKMKRIFKEMSTNLYLKGTNEKLSPEKRYSGRFLTISDIVKGVASEQAHFIDLPWYYATDSWESYCDFLSSGERHTIKRPSKQLLSYKECNPIGHDEFKGGEQDG